MSSARSIQRQAEIRAPRGARALSPDIDRPLSA
jgi:hypothetical protein